MVTGERGGKGRDGRGHTGDQWSWKSKIKIINMTPKEKKNPYNFYRFGLIGIFLKKATKFRKLHMSS